MFPFPNVAGLYCLPHKGLSGTIQSRIKLTQRHLEKICIISAVYTHTHTHIPTYTVPLHNCEFTCEAMHLIALAAIEWWQWPQWELARLCRDVCNYSAAQKEGLMRCQSRFTVSVVSAFSRVSNDVHLRAKLPEHCLPLLLECRPHWEQEPGEGEKEEEKKKKPSWSAEVQIKANNDLIVRGTAGRRWMVSMEAEAREKLKCLTFFFFGKGPSLHTLLTAS